MELVKKFIFSWGKFAATAVLGWIVFWIFKRKTIVVIVSTYRSGSTLLKALLGQAEDVSHLPEIFFSGGHWSRRFPRLYAYSCYFQAYRASAHRIVVFKKPLGPNHLKKGVNHFENLPRLSLRIIIMVRRPGDVISSIQKIPAEVGPGSFSRSELYEYLFHYYQFTNRLIQDTDYFFTTVSYEELVAKPIEVTSALFSFIGSKHQKGVSDYQQDPGVLWTWGTDDGGALIRKMKVDSQSQKSVPGQNYLDLVRTSKTSRQFAQKIEKLFEV